MAVGKGAIVRDRARPQVTHEVREVSQGKRGRVVRTRSSDGQTMVMEADRFEAAVQGEAVEGRSRANSRAYREGWERVFGARRRGV